MNEYYDLCSKILERGEEINDERTGTGTLSLFGDQIEFDLTKGFPLLTGKFTSFNAIKAELLWFLAGSTNNAYLRKLNDSDKPTIWEEWANELGELGPIYGKQWRAWDNIEVTRHVDQVQFKGAGNYYYNATINPSTTDQIKVLVEGLKLRPRSRRHIVSAWNVADLPDECVSPQENVEEGRMSLAPCHTFFQLNLRRLRNFERVDALGLACQQALAGAANPERALDGLGAPKYALTCKMYQRSADMFLGVPFNIASYALLTHMIAQVTNMVPERLIITFGDTHVYQNHVREMETLLSRRGIAPRLPTLQLNKDVRDIDDFTMEDIKVDDYLFLPAIKAPVSV